MKILWHFVWIYCELSLLCYYVFSSFQEWANTMARRPSSVRLSVCLSVNFCANRFFSQANGPIATKLADDGLQVSLHPECAQGQGQRSRDTLTFLDSWNEPLRHWRSVFFWGPLRGCLPLLPCRHPSIVSYVLFCTAVLEIKYVCMYRKVGNVCQNAMQAYAAKT